MSTGEWAILTLVTVVGTTCDGLILAYLQVF